jgi:hypothetical protein
VSSKYTRFPVFRPIHLSEKGLETALEDYPYVVLNHDMDFTRQLQVRRRRYEMGGEVMFMYLILAWTGNVMTYAAKMVLLESRIDERHDVGDYKFDIHRDNLKEALDPLMASAVEPILVYTVLSYTAMHESAAVGLVDKFRHDVATFGIVDRRSVSYWLELIDDNFQDAEDYAHHFDNIEDWAKEFRQLDDVRARQAASQIMTGIYGLQELLHALRELMEDPNVTLVNEEDSVEGWGIVFRDVELVEETEDDDDDFEVDLDMDVWGGVFDG